MNHCIICATFLVVLTVQSGFSNPAAELKSQLIGKWEINHQKTLSIPIDEEKFPGLTEDRKKRLSFPISWEYRDDGTVVQRFRSSETLFRFFVMEQDNGRLWIVHGRSDNFTLHDAKIESDGIVISPIALRDNGEEVSMTGPLFIEKVAEHLLSPDKQDTK